MSGEASRLAPSFLPTTAVLEVTGRCNHDCLFCSCPWYRAGGSYETGPELTTREWKVVLDKLCAMGVVNVAFTGGEALLRDDLREMMEHAAGLQAEHIETKGGRLVSSLKPPRLYLLTNGRLFTREWMDWCRTRAVQPSFSLPGLTAFRELTGYDGADHVLQCFSWARELGVSAVANITVTRLNLHELERTIAAALAAGARQVLLNRFLPGGRGLAHAARLELDADGVREMLNVAEDTLARAGAFGNVGTELPRCLVPAREFKHLEVGSRCSAAQGFFVVGPEGRVRVCNHSETQLAPVWNIDELKHDDYWKTFAFRRYAPSCRAGCAKGDGCDAGCREAMHIVAGDVSAPDRLAVPV
ncbi:MAG TPA: radical SAM protein [Kiritimatiellia bacterium]|nr:radical SAM protein [Kiritimatiellia bacterium]HPR67687.1 radical SAM protein [Kiritimatiellia bacterium]HRX06790.1 radical SAM protein [Kiritimatiellia bacterium]